MNESLFFQSHCLDTLVDELFQNLEKDKIDPFSKFFVVVQHPALKEWLQVQICNRTKNNAIARFEILTFMEAISKIYSYVPFPSRFDLSCAIWLESSLISSSKKKLETTKMLSQSFYTCGVFGDSSQAPLDLKALFENVFSKNGWITIPKLFESQNFDKTYQIYLFDTDFFPAPILKFFIQYPKIRIFRFSPCAMYWEDLCSTSERKKLLKHAISKKIKPNILTALDESFRQTHPLLANWGIVGRKSLPFFLNIDFIESYPFEENETLLSQLKLDLLLLKNSDLNQISLNLETAVQDDKVMQDFELESFSMGGDHSQKVKAPPIESDYSSKDYVNLSSWAAVSRLNDPSIQCFQAGSSKLREVELIRDEILKLAIAKVPLSQIRIYAPNISEYSSYIEFVFNDPEMMIPYKILGVDLAKKSPYFQALTLLFQCVSGRWEVSDILTLFKLSPFYKKNGFQKEEISQIETWLREYGVRWGLDQNHRNEITLEKPHATSKQSWEDSFESMLNSWIFLNPHQSHFFSWSDADLFQKFFTLFQKLKTTLYSWKKEKTLDDWAKEMSQFIEEILDPEIENSLNRFAKKTFDSFIFSLKTSPFKQDQLFPFSFIEKFFQSKATEIEHSTLFEAVTCCSLEAGNMIPGAAIFLIGMDEDSFPRSRSSSVLHIPHPDELKQPDIDRYLFLQSIFAAKNHFYLSYCHLSKEDGKTVNPSILIQELCSYLKSKVQKDSFSIFKTFPSSSLHPDCFQTRETFSSKKFIAAKAHLEQKKGSFIYNTKCLPPIEVNHSMIPIQTLKRFIRHPFEYFLKEHLDIEIPQCQSSLWDEFEFSSLDQYVLLQSSLESKGKPTQYPIGLFGDTAKEISSNRIHQCKAALQNWEIDHLYTTQLLLTCEDSHTLDLCHFSDRRPRDICSRGSYLKREGVKQPLPVLNNLSVRLQPNVRGQIDEAGSPKNDISRDTFSTHKALEFEINSHCISITGEIPFVSSKGMVCLGKDQIGSVLRRWPELLAGLIVTGSNQIFFPTSGKFKKIENPEYSLKLFIELFFRCQKTPFFLHPTWADSVLRKKMPPDIETEDPIIQWVLNKSPQFDLEKEMEIWSDLLQETFASLIAMYPTRTKSC